MENIFNYLNERPYPGRGILLGKTPMGSPVAAYFIMGRSENSRNRVFAETKDGIRTEAYEPSRMTDPSLIIYHPVRAVGERLVVTNGDQTDIIRERLLEGQSFAEALKTCRFEPDGPFWTPRISGVLGPDGSYCLSIIKTLDGDASCCCRFFFEYEAPPAGTGHFISTYEGGGEPAPSFIGEPRMFGIACESARELAERLWESLDADNKVSLYANVGGETVIVNKYALL